MPLDLDKVALVTAQRYCRPTASYGVEDAAQVARLALHNQMPAWDPARSAERTFAINVAKRAIFAENRAKRNRGAGSLALPTTLPGFDWDVQNGVGAMTLHPGQNGDAAQITASGDWLWCLGEEDRGYAAADARDAVKYIWQQSTSLQRKVITAFLDLQDIPSAARRLRLPRETVRKVLRSIPARLRRETGYEVTARRGPKNVYYGVAREGGASNPWRARVQHDGRKLSVGLYPTKRQAAVAYDKAAKALFGDEALLNFPEEQ